MDSVSHDLNKKTTKEKSRAEAQTNVCVEQSWITQVCHDVRLCFAFWRHGGDSSDVFPNEDSFILVRCCSFPSAQHLKHHRSVRQDLSSRKPPTQGQPQGLLFIAEAISLQHITWLMTITYWLTLISIYKLEDCLPINKCHCRYDGVSAVISSVYNAHYK